MTLRVLLVEDREADAELVVAHLRGAGLDVVGLRVDSAEAFTRALSEFTPDVVLSDRGMPQFGALDALEMLKAVRPSTPFIVVSGAIDEQAAVSYLRGGADDLVLKTNLSRLGPALRDALALRERLAALTPRQLEVLRLVVMGHTSGQIAERLDISLKTVETHRSEMMKRLAIHDVAGLVRYAVKTRLIPPNG